MGRHKVFTFKVNQNERQLIVTLAECLRRSQSDAVRYVVLEAPRELETQDATPTDAETMRAQSHDMMPTTHGKDSRTKRLFGLRVDYLILGIILGIAISIVSLLLPPDWAHSNLALVILCPVAFAAATSVIANFRKTYE